MKQQRQNLLIPALRWTLQRLSPLPRQIITLRYGAGLSLAEISETLVLSPSTVSAVLEMTLVHLSIDLTGLGVGQPPLDPESLHAALCCDYVPDEVNERVLSRVLRNIREGRAPMSRFNDAMDPISPRNRVALRLRYTKQERLNQRRSCGGFW